MVNQKLVKLALERATGAAFEDFFKAFFSALYGDSFIPLGGSNDGGADAFEDRIFERKEGVSQFFQASVQKDFRTKIRATVARLKEFGRTPKTLVYCTSLVIKNLDREEDTLTKELSLIIRIRDGQYIVANINNSSQTEAAFCSYLQPEVAFLQHIGASDIAASIPGRDQRALFVFLQQELARRESNADLINSVTDSLILWALEGTDPQKGIVRNRIDILTKVERILPTARTFVRGTIDHRLHCLSSKNGTGGREIQFHSKLNGYCLPYQTRRLVEAENVDDVLLKQSVSDIFRANAEMALDASLAHLSPKVVEVCHRVVEKAFYSQGLEVAAFIADVDSETHDNHLVLSDCVDEALTEIDGIASHAAAVKLAVLSVLRKAFYESSTQERSYFQKLSRTFALFFSLRADGRVLDYFKAMSAKFVLYVGADLIIHSLSERYLRNEDRVTTILLEMLHKCGATLILSQKAFEEIYSHICATDQEFQNWYRNIELHTTVDIARHCSKILIRAYFYARCRPPDGVTGPINWPSYINQFVTLTELYKPNGSDELLRYLCERYHLKYEATEEMLRGVESGQINALTEMLQGVKPNKEKGDILAYNDALQILRVYAKRREIGDGSKNSAYGYRVWWLTHETHVMRATHSLVKHHNSRYIMRPEFALNFVALAPSTAEVRAAYRDVFPSLLAIQLSNRLKDVVLHDLIRRVREAEDWDDARIAVKMQDLSNRLKGDNYKEYENDVGQMDFRD